MPYQVAIDQDFAKLIGEIDKGEGTLTTSNTVLLAFKYEDIYLSPFKSIHDWAWRNFESLWKN